MYAIVGIDYRPSTCNKPYLCLRGTQSVCSKRRNTIMIVVVIAEITSATTTIERRRTPRDGRAVRLVELLYTPIESDKYLMRGAPSLHRRILRVTRRHTGHNIIYPVPTAINQRRTRPRVVRDS